MHHMIELKWCRMSINEHTARVKHVFKWAVENELVPPSVHHGLVAVSGLHKGRSDVVESEPVQRVADADVDAVIPHLSDRGGGDGATSTADRDVPGEACEMRGCDLDATGKLCRHAPDVRAAGGQSP